MKVLSTQKFDTYEIREELIDGAEYGGDDFTIHSAYSLKDGSYIGDVATAQMLAKRGIIPEVIEGNKTASIGWCEKEQKFYGWSHRAIYGFGIGSKVKMGDCGYTPANFQEVCEDLEREYGYGNKNIKVKEAQNGVEVNRSYESGLNYSYFIEYGKGEWEAKTLEDAKQMAIDFARSVS